MPDYKLGLTMTRALGFSKVDYISKTMEFNHFEISLGDKFIIVGNNGLWQMMSPSECVEFVLNCNENDPAQSLVDECRNRWRSVFEELGKILDQSELEEYADHKRKKIPDITASIVVFDN